MQSKSLSEKIVELKKEKDVVILSHYYQNPLIQDVADFVGDSLSLSKEAAKTSAKTILFAGVHFMAETAKILNPTKKVIIPDLDAGCSLSDSCPPKEFEKFIQKHPNHVVVSYINCSAQIKALSDIICTSSNAIKVIESIPKNKKIIFAPDKNLGRYLSVLTKREFLLWDGTCIVHQEFSEEALQKLKFKYPLAKVLAHPECDSHMLGVADFIGSTKALLEFSINDKSSTYIVATESFLLYQMRKLSPNKNFIEAPVIKSCSACQQCPFMKKNTLLKLYYCLKNEAPEILIKKDLLEKASKSVYEMMNVC